MKLRSTWKFSGYRALNIWLEKWHTCIAQKHWQEDQAMSGSDQNNTQIHPEVEDAEDLWFGKGQHNNSSEFGQGDSREYLKIKQTNVEHEVEKKVLKAALTELPILVRVSWALCTRSSPTLTAKALVIWEENSTEIPTAMTKLTNETAFNVMFHLKINKKS